MSVDTTNGQSRYVLSMRDPVRRVYVSPTPISAVAPTAGVRGANPGLIKETEIERHTPRLEGAGGHRGTPDTAQHRQLRTSHGHATASETPSCLDTLTALLQTETSRDSKDVKVQLMFNNSRS